MKKNLVFIGPIAAGKGTQADILAAKHGYIHLSTGQIFREIVALGSDLGRKVKNIIESGFLVPDQVTDDVVAETMSGLDISRGLIFDGYPRTLPQVRALDEILAKYRLSLDMAVFIDVSAEETIRRIVGRYTCAKCGAVYHDKLHPAPGGKCECGSKDFVRRKDDEPEIVKIRLERYCEDSMPIINTYESRGILVRIDASNIAISQVTEEIEKVIV